MKIQASIEFLLIASAISAMILVVISLYAKNIFAQDSVLANAANISLNSTNFTAAVPLNQTTAPVPSSNVYSALIAARNESLAYNISAPVYVISLREFSHCTYLGFSGNPGNVGGECGTANAWDYMADAACGPTTTYCILPNNTRYALESTTAQRSYLYNFSLVIESQAGTMQANMSSSQEEASVMLAGKSVGYASVVAVASAEPFQSVDLISNSTAYGLLNQTAYGQYVQAKNLIYPLLSFYNSTSVDSATQASIQQAISSFNSSSVSIRSMRQTTLPCQISGEVYVCSASYPFFYIINVTLTNSSVDNQTFYYLGSVITLRGS